MYRARLLFLVLAACGDDGAATIDAAGPDGPPDAPAFDCATSPTSGKHKVYLALDGVTLTRSTTNDAVMNTSEIVDDSRQTATVPAWRSGAPDRAAQIAALVCAVREPLQRFDLEIVTTRPATGDYEMIVVGGSPTDLGYAFPNGGGNKLIAAFDCENLNVRDVGWVAEIPVPSIPSLTMGAIETGAAVVAVLGIGGGLGFSNTLTNCMCSTRNDANMACDYSKVCELSTASPISSGANECNVVGGVEDQIAKLTARYGARP